MVRPLSVSQRRLTTEEGMVIAWHVLTTLSCALVLGNPQVRRILDLFPNYYPYWLVAGVGERSAQFIQLREWQVCQGRCTELELGYWFCHTPRSAKEVPRLFEFICFELQFRNPMNSGRSVVIPPNNSDYYVLHAPVDVVFPHLRHRTGVLNVDKGANGTIWEQ